MCTDICLALPSLYLSNRRKGWVEGRMGRGEEERGGERKGGEEKERGQGRGEEGRWEGREKEQAEERLLTTTV